MLFIDEFFFFRIMDLSNGDNQERNKMILTLNGERLSLDDVTHLMKDPSSVHVSADPAALEEVAKNAEYLQKKISEGCIIYGVNTGYGGSADVRSSDLLAVQRTLVTHLNAGFGRKFDCAVPRAVMVVRANSLLRARYVSGWRMIFQPSLPSLIFTHSGVVTPYGDRDLGQHWLM